MDNLQLQTRTRIQADTSIYVKAPERLYKHIIGKEGKNIKRIKQNCPMVQLKCLEGQDKIQVVGPAEQVKQAVFDLQAFVKALKLRYGLAEIEMESQFIKHIIGKEGANIKRIRNEHGVKIVINPYTEHSSIICVEGEPKSVQAAKLQLMAIIKEIRIVIPHKLHASIIGVKGCLINSIKDECGDVIIHFPPKSSTSNKVLIRGPYRCASHAIEHLLEFKRLKSISEAIKRHTKVGEGSHKSDSRSYGCSFCNKRFATKSRMEQHKRHHSTDFSAHECELCRKKSFTKMKLKQQKYCAHYECYNCHKIYSTKMEPFQDLHHKDFRSCSRHLFDEEHSAKKMRQYLHNNIGARCRQCNFSAKSYSSRWNRWQHLCICKDFKCYECDICDKVCLTQRALWQHLCDHKDFRPFECYICDERWPTKREFLQHLYCHEDFTCYECKICDMGFSTLMSLWRHFSCHKDFDPYESCVFLERHTDETQVEEYKAIHDEFTLYEMGHFEEIFSKLGDVDLLKSHSCELCCRRFSDINDLEQHKKYHKSFRTFECGICDRRFSTKKEMDEHNRHHKDFRHYQCLLCGSIFSTINEMKSHVVNHKDFHFNQCCRICGAICLTMNEMEKHMNHHQDLSHQKCDICYKSFYTMIELEQHRQHHQEI